MESKLKHLEMIQAVITRMANNSFMLKGWAVILTSAIFAFVAKDANKLFILLAIFPVIAFWGLDGYYLRQERLFRKLYDQVRGKHELEVDFSMDTSPFNNQVERWFRVCFSKTVCPIYLAILIVTIVVLALVFIIHC